MSTTFYKRENGKYVPISEYDDDFCNSFRKGASLVVTVPGVKVTKYNVEAEAAPLLAAAIHAEDLVIKALLDASTAKPNPTLLTERQLELWNQLKNELGSSISLCHPSAYDVYYKLIDALINEANKTLENPAVKNAYDQFMVTWKISKDSENASE